MNDEDITKLKLLLENHEKRIKRIEEFIEKFENSSYVEDIELLGMEKLSKKTGVNGEKLKEIFDIENEQLTVVKITGDKERDKTQNITLLVLIGYNYLFGEEEVLSQEIRRNVGENGISLNNFAKHLNKMIPSLIRRKDKAKSPKNAYKLTALGKSKSLELIKIVAGV